ncbi:MAG: ABC transporter permease [Gemmatimonas sp.]
METLAQDVRFAVRSLAKSRGFALVAIITLALGIGVNSAVFSVVNAILYRPLPVHAPTELVELYGKQEAETSYGTHSYLNYLSYREANTTLSDLIAYSNFMANLVVEGSSQLAVGELVSDNYFTGLGVRPALGRFFTPEEAAPIGGATYVVLSDRFWRSRFNAAPNVVGKTLRMNGTIYTVVGVADPSFGGMIPGATSQMWIPVTMAEQVEPFGNQRVPALTPGTTRFDRRGVHWMSMKGRMKPGITPQQVQAEFEGILGRLAAEYPVMLGKERIATFATTDVRINPAADRYLEPAGMLLIAAVGLVLLVACANLANLMLARAAGRGHEIALRVALGATRLRIARQLVTESLVLALVGGALAFPLAAGLTAVVSRIKPPLPIDIGLSISPDWRVMLYTLLIAIGTGIAFGLVPAIRASRPDLVPALKEGANDGTRGRFRLRDALVVAQMAVSLVLIVVGALFVRSLSAAADVPLGYDAGRIGFLTVPLEFIGYDDKRGGVLMEQARQRLADVPGVQAVSLTSRLPLSLNNNNFGIRVVGREDDRPYTIDGAYVDEHYLNAMSLTLLAGRAIVSADREESPRVMVITRAMAQRFWPGAPENAVGRQVRTRADGPMYQIVGVVADHTVDTPGEPAKSYVLLPLERDLNYGNYIIRTATPAAGMITTFEREVRELEPDAVFMDRGTFRELADHKLFPVRAGAWLIGACGLLALLVAAVGLYGVIAYSVNRRVRELGIRAALGAEPALIVRMVIREGMLLVGIGAALGAVMAFGAAKVLSGVLFVAPFDPVSFALATGVLASAALLANAVPAWRASRVDPMLALRSS